ncbi:MAG: hypothetical protein WC061_02055 [Melioribacteraceae bacterium]
MQKVMKYLAYATGTIFLLLGAVILFTNIFEMRQLPDQFRLMLGVVLILYGFFRIVSTVFKKPPKNEKV